MPLHSLQNLSWLFHQHTPKSSTVGSCATFNPIRAAHSQDAWENTTGPSTEAQKKTVVFTSDFSYSEAPDLFAILTWLRNDGFDIRLCIFDEKTGKKEIRSFSGNDDLPYLSQLTTFDQKKDFNMLAAQRVPHDHAVILDWDKFHQIDHFLDQPQRVPNSNAISTATTLRFHHYSKEIRHIEDLAAHLRDAASEEAAVELLLRHMDIFPAEECLRACPPAVIKHLVVENRYKITTYEEFYALLAKADPDTALMLINAHGDKIRTQSELENCLESCPIHAESLIRVYSNNVLLDEDKDQFKLFYKYIPFIVKDVPDFPLIPTRQCWDKISTLENPLKYLKWCPEYAEKLVRERGGIDKCGIDNGDDLAEYLQCFPSIQKELLACYPVIKDNAQLLKCAMTGHTVASELIKSCSVEITDGYTLATYLIANPLTAEELIEEHTSKIKTLDLLNMCLNACQLATNASALQKFFLEKHWDKVAQNLHKLNYYVKKYPAAFDACMWKFSGRVFEHPDLIGQLIKHCPTAPQTLAKLCEDHITNGRQLAVHLAAFPSDAEMLIRKYRHKIEIAKELKLCTDLLCPTMIGSLLSYFKEKKVNVNNLRLFLEIYPQETKFLLKKYPNNIQSRVASQDPLKYGPVLLERYVSGDHSKSYSEHNGTIPYLSDLTALENITCLYIGVMDGHHFPKIVKIIKNNQLSKLSAIEVVECTDENIECLMSIFILLKQRKLCVFLPENLRGKIHLPENFIVSYTNYSKYTPLNTSSSSTGALHYATPRTTASQQPAPNPNGLYLANNGLGSTFDSTNRTPGYEMVQAGEVLNKKKHWEEPSIRTGIMDIDFASNGKDISQHYRDPTEFLPIDLSLSGEEEFQEKVDEAKQSHDGMYVKFTQHIKANQTIRLLSIDAAETLLAIHAVPQPAGSVAIEKGNDGFYYATASAACTLNYLIKSPLPNELTSLYKNIPANNFIKKIIEAYKTNPNYHVFAQKNKVLPPFPPAVQNRGAWFETLYAQCLGSCRHRVAAVYYKILQEAIQTGQGPNIKDKVRMVDINNHHMRLEIKDENDRWLQVDLGSTASSLNYTHTQKPYTSVDAPSPHLHNVKRSAPNIAPADPSLKKLHEKMEQKATGETENLFFQTWKAKNAPKLVSTEAEFLGRTLHNTRTKILCVTSNIRQRNIQANLLLQQARQLGRPVYYIDHPSKIDISESDKILLDVSGTPQLSSDSLLHRFLMQPQDPTNPPLLLINWEAFSPKKRLQLNTLIDTKRTIRGVVVPNAVQVIGLCAQIPEDSSFTSRHQTRLDANKFSPPTTPQPADGAAEKIMIDLEGVSNWQEELFGRIVQTPQGLVWEKSSFVEELCKASVAPRAFEITHASNPIALIYQLEQARALGKFSYHGFDIPWPEHVDIYCNASPFDFTVFQPIKVQHNVKRGGIPENIHLVNTYRFDFLLKNKKIHKGTYTELDGLIKESSGETLRLFITSTLTEAQWYCLLFNTEKHKVTLDISLAPNIKLPTKISTVIEKVDEKKEDNDNDGAVAQHAIYLTDHPETIVSSILQQHVPDAQLPPPLVLHVEDYHFNDLIFKLTFEKTKHGFENFNVVISDLLTALKEGRTVVLRGEFSEALWAELQPLLLGQPLKLPTGEVIPIKGQLICLVDPKQPADLNWLKKPLLCDHPPSAASPHPVDVPESKKFDEASLLAMHPNKYAGLQDSEIKANAFIENRRQVLVTALESNDLLLLIGKSGIGKSRLLADIKANSLCEIYNELSSFEAWATDNNRDKSKILFIDESNIEDLHFTIFEPLKPGGSKEILYQGKRYKLDEQHKVVFACNPHSYGGGRHKQKLFSDNCITEIHLADFTDAYIYEHIIQPTLKLYNIPIDDDFKAHLITDYRKQKERNPNFTVRELQEYVLTVCQNIQDSALFYEPNSMPIPAMDAKVDKDDKDDKEDKAQPSKEKFLPNSANGHLLSSLNTFIAIRKRAREKNIDLNGMGLNGVLIEGKPATGKSEAIYHALKQSGYRIVNDLKQAEATDYPFLCYKIDADLSLAEKRCIIIHAFEHGHAIWIDELNSCIDNDNDNGLEKILNLVLTGEHPDTKNKPKLPGFMAFFTANSAGLAGRDMIGEALRHRNIQMETTDYQEEDLEPIFAQKFPRHSPPEQKAAVDNFMILQKHGYDLRSYVEDLKTEADAEQEKNAQKALTNCRATSFTMPMSKPLSSQISAAALP